MECKSCGKSLDNVKKPANFCPNCGKELDDSLSRVRNGQTSINDERIGNGLSPLPDPVASAKLTVQRD